MLPKKNRSELSSSKAIFLAQWWAAVKSSDLPFVASQDGTLKTLEKKNCSPQFAKGSPLSWKLMKCNHSKNRPEEAHRAHRIASIWVHMSLVLGKRSVEAKVDEIWRCRSDRVRKSFSENRCLLLSPNSDAPDGWGTTAEGHDREKSGEPVRILNL